MECDEEEGGIVGDANQNNETMLVSSFGPLCGLTCGVEFLKEVMQMSKMLNGAGVMRAKAKW